MIKSFRYNAKGKGLGIHSEFFKTLIDKNCYRGKMNLPKPQTHTEITLLAKFIFGVELTMRFEYCDDLLEKYLLNSKNLKFKRYVKLMKLNPDKDKDYIPRQKLAMNKKDKMILLWLRYFCNQKHNDYYDHKFTYEVFNSSYDVDSYFWRHCFDELCCGGIASSCYGQVEITSLKDRTRILNIYSGKDGIREEFQKEINELIEKDKQYD